MIPCQFKREKSMQEQMWVKLPIKLRLHLESSAVKNFIHEKVILHALFIMNGTRSLFHLIRRYYYLKQKESLEATIKLSLYGEATTNACIRIGYLHHAPWDATLSWSHVNTGRHVHRAAFFFFKSQFFTTFNSIEILTQSTLIAQLKFTTA